LATDVGTFAQTVGSTQYYVAMFCCRFDDHVGSSQISAAVLEIQCNSVKIVLLVSLFVYLHTYKKRCGLYDGCESCDSRRGGRAGNP